MQITRKVMVTTEITETVKPGFYKTKHSGLTAIYPDGKLVAVMVLSNGYVHVSTERTETFTGELEGEITEQEFNDELAKALFMIAGVEVVPTFTLQTVS